MRALLLVLTICGAANGGIIMGRFHGEDFVCCGTFRIDFNGDSIQRLTLDWDREPGVLLGVPYEAASIHGSAPVGGVVNWPTTLFATSVADIGGYEVAFAAEEINYRPKGSTAWHDEAIAIDYVIVPEPGAWMLFAYGALVLMICYLVSPRRR